MLNLKKIIECSNKALMDTVRHDGIEHAGYLAFLSLLSLFPFLVFMFAIAGFIGQTEIGLKLISIILNSKLIPEHILKALEPRFQEIESGPPQGLLTFAIIGAIWTASSAVEGLRTILNRAYRVHTPPAYLLRRLLSIGQFLIVTAISLFILFMLIIIPQFWDKIQIFVNNHDINLQNSIILSISTYTWHFITLFLLFFVVCAAYFTLPNIKQNWIAVTPGAFCVVILWFCAGNLFSLYLSNFNQVNVIYGSLGGFIAALLFFYIAATIFIYGAELNYHLEKAMGLKIIEKSKWQNNA